MNRSDDQVINHLDAHNLARLNHQKKKAADLCDQWPFVCGLFLLLDFYFVTFFEGGEISPEKWSVRNKWSRGKAPQMIE